MEIEKIRKFLLETIGSGDEKLLRMLHSIVLSHTNTYELQQWQKEELGRRLKSNEKGISWEEAKRRIRANYKAKYLDSTTHKD